MVGNVIHGTIRCRGGVTRTGVCPDAVIAIESKCCASNCDKRIRDPNLDLYFKLVGPFTTTRLSDSYLFGMGK